MRDEKSGKRSAGKRSKGRTKLERAWESRAELFLWAKKWRTVLSGSFVRGTTRWFSGARLNITENCLDRHLPLQSDKVAIYWEPNDPDGKGISLTYGELSRAVGRMANVLLSQGVKKGDFVCIYLPMIPEAAIAMLACARIGAVHNFVFGGFSAKSLADRINDCGARVLITCDVSLRGPKKIDFRVLAEQALAECPKVKKVLFVENGTKRKPLPSLFVSLNKELAKASPICAPTLIGAEDPLFVLYTSGSTGRTKGLLHAAGGYMVYAGYSFNEVFNYQPKEVYWCTADMGWITGHTYSLYGPLLAGATVVMFEGVPTYPTPKRYWEIIEKYRVNIFYTAPTVIRALAAFGPDQVKKLKLKSLRLLGSVGEPLNQEAWHWYHHYIGKGRCPIVDTWWQTETGGILISPPSGGLTKPGSVGLPLPLIDTAIVDSNGKEVRKAGVSGYLCVKGPWPGLAKTILNDSARFVKGYFSKIKGYYFSGDAAWRDSDGYYFVSGRVDDVMNVSGQRIGSAEVENALCLHPDVAEASVVSYRHEIKGEGIYAFIVLKRDRLDADLLREELVVAVARSIGPTAKPGKIQIVTGLPKTRSGKIMRRLLRRLAAGESCVGEDLSTLTDQNVIVDIAKGIVGEK